MPRGILVLVLLVPLASQTPSLADRLQAAATDSERVSLLDAEPAAVDAALLDVLSKRGDDALAHLEFPKAIEAYRAATTVAERLHNPLGIAQAQLGEGRALYRLTKFADAVPLVRAAAEHSPSQPLAAFAWRVLATTYVQMANNAASIDAARHSLEIYRAVGDQSGVAGAQFNIANAYFRMGQYRQAAELYEECIKIVAPFPDNAILDLALKNLGSIYSEQGDYPVALSHLEHAIRIEEEAKLDQRAIANTLSILGIVYRRVGRYAEALQTIDRGLKLAESSSETVLRGTLLSTRGTIRHYQGDDRGALEDYRQCAAFAQEHKLRSPELYARNDIALTELDLGHPEAALPEAERALELARQSNSPADLWGPLNTLGKTYRRMKRGAEARQAFRDSIVAIESWRTQIAGSDREGLNFFSAILSPYQELLAMSVEEGKAEEALAIAERAKARQLLDVLTRGRVQTAGNLSAADRAREEELSREAAQWNAAVSRPNPSAATLASFQKAAREFEAFRASLYTAHPELKVRRGEADPLTPDDAAALLPGAHSLLLEYALTPDATYASVLARADSGKTSLTVRKRPREGKRLQARAPTLRPASAGRGRA